MFHKFLRVSLLFAEKKILFKRIKDFVKTPKIHKSTICRQSFFSVLIYSFISVAKAEHFTSNYKKKERKVTNTEITVDSVIVEADELFLIGKFKESYTILSGFKDTDNVEILWRLSRALYNMSKQREIDKNEFVSYINEGYKYINKALELNDEHYAVHKWMAILVDAKSSIEGIKSRISTLPIFKKHLMRAVELNPKDATTIHMLGQYMYNIADMTWLQLQIAKMLFGTFPDASFEEAFYYFNKAEEAEPNFYSANLLMLGKTCLKLKRIEAACFWLKCATSYPVRTDEDEAVRLEAAELLKKNMQKTETKPKVIEIVQ